ncbi:ABC transporter ATP-binding protein [Comamonas antarctica]|uniref:ABC transporter ATP-binding protein n=1 Tax=Comamonas antarctica TaxID=2743470 RepID=UPI0028EDC02C|nr:ABC transporter ATP-binding protein [Comamonas antarctica]
MSSNDVAIRVSHLSKCYEIYAAPRDRLKQFIVPRLLRLIGKPARRYFREFWALRDVSFEVKKGETVGIIGRNGSGKSTLLQIICGTVAPTQGTVSTHGRVAALLELGAGFNTEFTGRENVLLTAAILGFPQESMQARMNEVLAFSELGDFIDQPVKTYSSGMHARLAFSIAIHVDPEILIVDEALSVGDARFVAKCMRRIKEIQERGATILFVSHDVGSVRTLCQRAIWLDSGKLVEDGDVFPISGRYMEMMFRDEVAAEQGQAKAAEAPAGSVAHSGDAAATPAGAPTAHGLDARPVTHWGSHRGVILAASVCDANGMRRDTIGWGEPMEILIDVRIPPDIPREHLSLAFSIKDLKGTDLLVSTTYDAGTALPGSECFRVRFRMDNQLVTGKYLLVAAVENREHSNVAHYYEYFEGAHYFSSLADQRFFGIFQPAVQQSVQEA